MEYTRNLSACFMVSVVLLLFTKELLLCEAQLSPSFYDTTCPGALANIKTSIRLAVSRERRMAASLIRLHFHDCFVQGCDASVLLSDNGTFQGEQTAFVNINSIRGMDVIETAKAQVESICPGIVSCADILAVAARDASTLVGGPTWQVNLGRRDSTTASLAQTNIDMPRASESLDTLTSKFAVKGLNAKEMVALSGSHSIGQGRCTTFRTRIYSNGTNIDAGFASTRRRNCPQVGGDNNLAPIDLVTPNQFDNNYYKNLIQKKGLFSSDQVLFTSNGGPTDTFVSGYSNDPKSFSADFAAAMIKMGDIQPLTGQNGIIRKICSAPKS